jgi:hypothetical protein
MLELGVTLQTKMLWVFKSWTYILKIYEDELGKFDYFREDV